MQQIRDLYNRSWRTISKTLSLLQEMDSKKALQRELHYMLCLGELRKKGLMGLGQKVIMQLHDLVTNGFVYIRYRGEQHICWYLSEYMLNI